ncbi:TonB family protein [Erwinia sp. CPCC 100877]|nr:TonB family protein [Erwinia sp. CPCC 100877]
MTLDTPRRFPWPTLLSVVLHGAVVAGVFYTNQAVQLPAPSQQAISVSMVAPEAFEPPAPAPAAEPVSEPEPAVEPEPVPEPPKEAPVVIHKPRPKPKPKPKPLHKVEEKPKREAKPESRPASPFDSDKPARPSTSTSVARSNNNGASATSSAPGGPRAVSRNQPQYPSRAYALRMEGQVRVKFDVDSSGRVGNISILSAKPANMFDREVKQAMRKWRYEPGKPGTGLIVNIVFRINGGASVQ